MARCTGGSRGGRAVTRRWGDASQPVRRHGQPARPAGPGTRPDGRGGVRRNLGGAPLVNRYAPVGRRPDVLAARGLSGPVGSPTLGRTCTSAGNGRSRVPDAAHVNDWRYGFDHAPAYVDVNPGRSLERYLGRDVTIVLGELDQRRSLAAAPR